MRTFTRVLGPTLGLAFLLSSAACGSSKSAHRGERLTEVKSYDHELMVKIVEVGDGDEDWKNRGTLIGLECKVGPQGIRNEWSDGYYEGQLVDCSNGMSYDLEYVKVEVVSTTSTSQP